MFCCKGSEANLSWAQFLADFFDLFWMFLERPGNNLSGFNCSPPALHYSEAISVFNRYSLSCKTQRLGILRGMSFVRVIVLLSLTYADAVRPMAAEADVDLGNQSFPDCIGNLGKCCTVKCNGKHKWVGKTVLTFSDCQRQPGAFLNPSTQKVMRSSANRRSQEV